MFRENVYYTSPALVLHVYYWDLWTNDFQGIGAQLNWSVHKSYFRQKPEINRLISTRFFPRWLLVGSI